VYENEWELFQAEYQIVDAVFRIAHKTHQLVDPKKHGERIRCLCDFFGIPSDDAKVGHIVKLRNELLHEALWDERMPGEARSPDSLYASIWLHKLTRRLLLAVLGITGTYVQSGWWGMGQTLFAVS